MSNRLALQWERIQANYLLRGTSILWVATLIGVVISFGRTTLLTRALDKTSFGLINYVFIWLSFSALLSLPGMNSAVMQYAARGHKAALKEGITARIRWMALSILALLVVGAIASIQSKTSVSLIAFMVAALFFSTTQILAQVSTYLAARKQIWALFTYRIVERIFALGGAGLGIWLFTQPWQSVGVLGAHFIFLTLLNLATLIYIQHMADQDILPDEDWTNVRSDFLTFGRSLTGIGVISMIHAQADSLLVGTFLSIASLADYAVGKMIHEQLKSVWGVYYQVSYPRLTQLSPIGQRRQLIREMSFGIPVFALIAMLAGGGFSIFVPWAFSARYNTAIPFVWLLVLSFVFVLPTSFIDMYLRVIEAHKALYQLRITGSIIQLLIPFLLLFIWGAIGVAIGRVVGNILLSLYAIWIFRHPQAPVANDPGC